MATVELSLAQLRDALLQLPEPQRRQLLEDLQRLPTSERRARQRGACAAHFPHACPPAQTHVSPSLPKAMTAHSRPRKAKNSTLW